MAEEIKKEENRKLTEEELKQWNEMYEKYKDELPKSVYQCFQKYCILTVMLLSIKLPVDVQNDLIHDAQNCIDDMQKFLTDLSNLLKELREKDDKEVTPENSEENLK